MRAQASAARPQWAERVRPRDARADLAAAKEKWIAAHGGGRSLKCGMPLMGVDVRSNAVVASAAWAQCGEGSVGEEGGEGGEGGEGSVGGEGGEAKVASAARPRWE